MPGDLIQDQLSQSYSKIKVSLFFHVSTSSPCRPSISRGPESALNGDNVGALVLEVRRTLPEIAMQPALERCACLMATPLMALLASSEQYT